MICMVCGWIKIYIVACNVLCNLTGLLCGDPVPQWNGPAGAEGAADPSVVTEGDLSARICSQRPRSDESQVSERAHTSEMLLSVHTATDKWVISAGCVVLCARYSVCPSHLSRLKYHSDTQWCVAAVKFIQTFMIHWGWSQLTLWSPDLSYSSTSS